MLQAQLAAVTDALRTVAAKLDEQAGVQRKAFADQKLLADTMSNDLRVVREKIDDNNVRISSIGQELDALRLSVAQGAQPVAPPTGAEGQPPVGAPVQGGQQPPPPANIPNPGVSPTRLYDMAWADYAGGQYDLAIQGFTDFIKTFPKLDQAGAAQVLHRRDLLRAGQVPRCGDRLRPGDRGLPEQREGAGRLLQARPRAQRARADRPRPRELGLRGEELPERRRRSALEAEARSAAEEGRGTAGRRGTNTRAVTGMVTVICRLGDLVVCGFFGPVVSLTMGESLWKSSSREIVKSHD